MARIFYDQGRYWGKITRQRLGESSNGNPQLILSFTVLGKINPADPQGELLAVTQQYERTVFRTITDKTIDWVLKDLETIGFTGGSYGQFDENASDCCDVRGKELEFSCNHKAHYKTGEPVEEWSIASDSPGMEVEPLDNQAVRKLDAMFGKQLKKKSAEPAAPPEKKTLTERFQERTGGAKPKKESPLKETFVPEGDGDDGEPCPF